MNLADAKTLALHEMREHGLSDWSFGFDSAKRRFGACHHSRKRLTLSRALVLLNGEAEARETVLHEIAHALAPARAGHGPAWVRIALELGSLARSCYDDDAIRTPRGSFVAECSGCGQEVSRFRLPRHRVSCGRCSRSFDPQFELAFRENPI